MQYVMDARNADQKPMPEKLLEARAGGGVGLPRLPGAFTTRAFGCVDW